MSELKVRTIYNGGYVRDLGIVEEGGSIGWLVYRHPDGQWVTLADLKVHIPANEGRVADLEARLEAALRSGGIANKAHAKAASERDEAQAIGEGMLRLLRGDDYVYWRARLRKITLRDGLATEGGE